jgi:hypothetical protein
MNIEGAEAFVIDDLIDAGMIDEFVGFYGSWDDVGKTDPAAGRRFQAVLAAHKIDHLPFNQRHSGGFFAPVKEALIRYDIANRIR